MLRLRSTWVAALAIVPSKLTTFELKIQRRLPRVAVQRGYPSGPVPTEDTLRGLRAQARRLTHVQLEHRLPEVSDGAGEPAGLVWRAAVPAEHTESD